jgi:hypothetical protein
MAISQDNHDLIRRLHALGLNKALAKQLVLEFTEWRIGSKDEWTVKRLKCLKVDLIRYMGGLPPMPDTWIEKRPGGVIPKGPFGALWKLSKTKPFSALNALNMYTALIYKPSSREDYAITPTQCAGFVEAVQRPSVSAEAKLAYSKLLEYIPMEFHAPVPKFHADPLLDIPVKPFKRSPIPGRGLVPKEEVFPRALIMLSKAPAFYYKHKELLDSALGVAKSLIPLMDQDAKVRDMSDSDSIPVILNKMTMNIINHDGIHDDPSDVVSGNVSFIQDSGYKLRHIFVTNELIQVASLPLQSFLMNELRELPQDATYDQESGVKRVQDHLKSGKTCYCFDLQKCSDNLPRFFQIQLFRKLGLDEKWVQWFSDITGSRWEIRDRVPPVPGKGIRAGYQIRPDLYHGRRDHSSYMRMTVGQQLGFGPSFPAFSLLHHSIVRGIIRLLQATGDTLPLGFSVREDGDPQFIPPTLAEYVLLGDDIEMANLWLARGYRSFMRMSGVPISESKTIISSKIAEFAGRVILPDKVVCTYKWKGRCSDDSFLELAKALGPRSLDLFRPRQRFIAEVMGWIPEPFGLGWNPEGKSYSERLRFTEELWLKLIDERDIRVRHYQRRTVRLNRMLYEHPEFTRGLTLECPPDLEGYSVLVKNLFLSSKLARQLLGEDWTLFIPNVDYLARSLDIGGLNGVEISGLLSRYSWIERLSHLTTLTILERKLELTL